MFRSPIRPRLSRFQANLLSNVVSKGWAAIVTIVFVPVYIQFLGIEAYGLIGLFTALLTIAQLLDLGIAPTVNRELARMSSFRLDKREAGNLIRTLELFAWLGGAIISISMLGASDWIAASWLQLDQIAVREARTSLQLIGILLGFQLPLGLYYGGLMGLQRQSLSNAVRIFGTTASAIGAVTVLAVVSADIVSFFRWQVAVASLQVLAVHHLLWKQIREATHQPKFSVQAILRVKNFAAGMTWLAITSIIASQADKLILSSLLPLARFGYYALAGVLAGGLRVVVTPLFDAIFPRLSEVIAKGTREELGMLYHRGAQLMSAMVLPIGLLLAMFSKEIVSLWTGDPIAAIQVGPVLTLLALGTTLNGLWVPPYALQLASGWTSLAVALNTALVLLLVPALIVLTSYYGMVGAAATWLALNAVGLLAGSLLTHRRILIGAWPRWISQDVLAPFVGAAGVSLAARILIPDISEPMLLMGALVAAWGSSFLATILMARYLREWLALSLRQIAS